MQGLTLRISSADFSGMLADVSLGTAQRMGVGRPWGVRGRNGSYQGIFAAGTELGSRGSGKRGPAHRLTTKSGARRSKARAHRAQVATCPLDLAPIAASSVHRDGPPRRGGPRRSRELRRNASGRSVRAAAAARTGSAVEEGWEGHCLERGRNRRSVK